MPSISQILLQTLGNTAVNKTDKIPCHYGAYITIKEYIHSVKYTACSWVVSAMEENRKEDGMETVIQASILNSCQRKTH